MFGKMRMITKYKNGDTNLFGNQKTIKIKLRE
jgi:hypothetical protein